MAGPTGLTPTVFLSLSEAPVTLVVKLYAPYVFLSECFERSCVGVKSDGQMKFSQHRILLLVVRLHAPQNVAEHAQSRNRIGAIGEFHPVEEFW